VNGLASVQKAVWALSLFFFMRAALSPPLATAQDGKFHLILVESRIHRLARYYKKTKRLPPNWKYESATASALVQG
jgi:hypothetical protein